MIRWRDGDVVDIGRAWSGAQEVVVRLRGEPASEVRALAYVHLVGAPAVGERVLLNTGALDLGLGTGGYAMVVALPDRLPPDPPPRPGHLVKARYLPLQPIVLGVDEPESPHHELLREADDLDGLPVVVADLHSAVPAVLSGVSVTRPGTGVAYVMTDGGALPLWFSRTVAALQEAGAIVGTVTVGQAFGGDVEAVTLHTGLLAARLVLRADIAVVTQGPGNLGTGTRWGFSGVAAGEAVNAVAALGGRPIAALRISAADPRPRHRGVSHHSLTAYGRVALASAEVVVPELDEPLASVVAADLASLQPRHRLVTVPVNGLVAALESAPAPLRTMGRQLPDDLVYFVAAAAAGRYAASILDDA